MRMSISTLLFFLSLMVIARSAGASFISIETNTIINTLDDHAQIIVTISNKGDEAAYNVKVSGEVGETPFSGYLKNSLAPNEQDREEFNTALRFKKSGRYPVIVNVEYTDANLYPFTAPSVTSLNYKDSSNARVGVTIPDATIAKTGSISLTVNNLDAVEREFHYRLIAPKEILIANPEGNITVNSGEGKTIPFDVKNLSALPGSSYPVFALFGYEDNDYHYSTVARGIIKVTKGSTLLTIYKWPLIGALVILVLIVVVYNSKNFRKRDSNT